MMSQRDQVCVCYVSEGEREREREKEGGRNHSLHLSRLGMFFILPCIDAFITVDLRTVSFDVPPQKVSAVCVLYMYLSLIKPEHSRRIFL